jgi:hypothetical protein
MVRGPREGSIPPAEDQRRAGAARLKDVDALERDDLEVARRTSPEDRARNLLALIRTGFRLKRAALRTRYPSESAEKIDARFGRWLARDDEQ